MKYSINFKLEKVLLFLLILIIKSLPLQAQNYQLIWSDEFNGTGAPDPSKWGYEIGANIRNSELQYYTNSLSNVRQNNGNLEITVIKENVGGKQYTSGSITTLNKASWTYGKIEGRFKMPKGQGLWACFWTLGTNFPQIGWPKCGEMDIFEHLNSEGIIHGTAHWAGANDVHVSSTNTVTVDVTQWHVYSIIWDANFIKWFVDDVQFHELRITGGLNYSDEFNLPQYVLINLPIGGSWPGPPDATTILPSTMYCDYVRVYKNMDTTPVAVTGFSISPTTLSMAPGGTQNLSIAFVPANATNQNVTWTSSNTAVATVNATGLITAVGTGSATIQGTTVDGGKIASCQVSVQNLIGVNKLVNGNFDANTTATQTPIGWSEWGPGVANAQTSADAPHSPNYKGIQWGTTAFEVAVFQSLTGIANGNYTMKAWVRSTGGQNFATMYAKGYGGSDLNYSIAASIPVWTQIQINNIKVTNNKCEVGFYQSSGKANKWTEYDDVEFYMNAVNPPAAMSVASLNAFDTPVQSTTVTEEPSNNASVYPNPVKSGGQLNIISEFSDFDVSILDLYGKTVYSNTANRNHTVIIGLPRLEKGIYAVRISNKGVYRIKKIIVTD